MNKTQLRRWLALPGVRDLRRRASPRPARRWTKGEVIAELQRVAKLLGDTPTVAEFNKHAAFWYHTVEKHFGSWNKGLEAAGLELNNFKGYTKQNCLRELTRVANILGHPPTRTEFNKHATFSARTVELYCGSWNDGLEAAGLTLTNFKGYTKAYCIRELKRVAKLLGHAPTTDAFDKNARCSSQTPVANFGSWNAALKAAGLPVNMAKRTKRECVKELQRVAKLLDTTPTGKEFEERGVFGRAAVIHTFGSWNAALKAAGLTPNIEREYTKQDVVKELRRVAKLIGRTPTGKEFNKHAAFCNDLISNPGHGRFNTRDEALKAAGLVSLRPTKQDCLKELRRVAKSLGRTPSSKEFGELATCRSTVIRIFGTWNKAAKAAGWGVEPGITKQDCVKELKRVAKLLGKAPTNAEFSKMATFWGNSVVRRFGTWNKGLKAARLI